MLIGKTDTKQRKNIEHNYWGNFFSESLTRSFLLYSSVVNKDKNGQNQKVEWSGGFTVNQTGRSNEDPIAAFVRTEVINAVTGREYQKRKW